MDPYGYDDGADDQQAQALAALAGIPLQQAKIEAKRRRGQAMFATPTPGGREVGRTYVASSPLEHLAAAMTRTMGLRDMKAADADMAPLIQQQQAGAAAQARQQLADKRFGQSIQRKRLGLDLDASARADAQAMAREADAARDAKYQQDMLGLKRREIDVKRELKAAEDAAKAKGDKSKAAEDLRKEFQGLNTYKNTQTVAESAKKMLSASETGPGDLSLLYGYMKLLDPGSTVRESEFTAAAQTGSLPERVQGWASRVVSGEKLPSEVREQFRKEARAVLQAQRDRYEETARPYRRLAEQAGVAPGDVVLDLGLDAMLAPPGAGAAAPGGPVQAKTKSERDALPPGTQYVGPDGKTYTKG